MSGEDSFLDSYWEDRLSGGDYCDDAGSYDDCEDFSDCEDCYDNCDDDCYDEFDDYDDDLYDDHDDFYGEAA